MSFNSFGSHGYPAISERMVPHILPKRSIIAHGSSFGTPIREFVPRIRHMVAKLPTVRRNLSKMPRRETGFWAESGTTMAGTPFGGIGGKPPLCHIQQTGEWRRYPDGSRLELFWKLTMRMPVERVRTALSRRLAPRAILEANNEDASGTGEDGAIPTARASGYSGS
jgi:hypothetical protein